jgi:hypothetical protein
VEESGSIAGGGSVLPVEENGTFNRLWRRTITSKRKHRLPNLRELISFFFFFLKRELISDLRENTDRER